MKSRSSLPHSLFVLSMLLQVAAAMPRPASAAAAPAPAAVGNPDGADCAPDPLGLPAAGVTSRPKSALERFVDLDRVVRQGCAPKPLLREWQDIFERLAPFTVEPDPLARVRAAEASRAIATPQAGAWANLGPRNQGGRLRGIAVDPRDPARVYVGAASGGVWKSTDAGGSWTPLTDGADALTTGTLRMDPANPDTLYWATGEGTYNADALPGAGVWKTTDAGATWRRVGEVFATKVNGLAILGNGALVAASNAGLWRSPDGGATWTQSYGGEGGDVVADAGNPAAAWASLSNGDFQPGPDNGVYRTTDGGATWAKQTVLSGGCGRIELAASPSSPQVAFAGCADPSTGGSMGIWKTTDGGGSWSQLAAAPNYCGTQCWYDNVIFVDPSDASVVWAAGLDVWKSTDGGTSWAQKTIWYPDPSLPTIHADQHVMEQAGGTLWIGNDGGLYRTADGGATWESRYAGLVATQLYGLASHPTDGNVLLGGFQDNGTKVYGGDASAWREVIGGDGGYCAINQTNPSEAFGEYVYLEIYKSTDGAASFPPYGVPPNTNGIPEDERKSKALFIAPFVSDPKNGSRLLAGTNRVFLTTDSAGVWTPVSGDLTEGQGGASVAALAFSPASSSVAWAGTTSGKVWKTTGLGGSNAWTNVTGSLPGRYVKRIAPDPSDANVCWVALSGYGGGHVFVTRDGGASWADASGNLPDSPTNGLVVDPADSNRIWAGNDVGAFESRNAGASWSRMGTGLPNVRVDELVFTASLRRLRAASHGRGVWEIGVDDGGGGPVAAFTFSPASPTAGQAVQFTDASTGDPTAWSWQFGDGTSSAERNPSHAYAAAGSYTVTLTASNAQGSSTATKSVAVVASGASYVAKLVVPGQARVTGSNNAFFKSSFWITNPTGALEQVRLRYVPAAGFGMGGGVETKEVAIAPAQSIAWRNVLEEAFGATENTSGVIVVEVAEGSGIPLVTSRTYNDAGAARGTFGQYIPAVDLASSAGGTLTMYGLGGDTKNRSNVGIVNLGTVEMTARITVLDPAGNPVGDPVDVTVGPRSANQKNRVNEAANVPGLPLFGARVTSSSPFFAYTSKLDNQTSDPIFVPGTLTAKARQWIDGVASASGQNNTFFRSNLSLTNPGGSAASVELKFTPRNGTEPTGSATVTLAPGETRFYTDLLAEIFSLAGAGQVSFATDEATPVVAWCRTYNDMGEAGTFGQFIPGFGAAELVGTSGAIFQGLSQSADSSSGFRTNMGFVNASASQVTLTAAIHAGDGTKLGESTFAVEAGQALFRKLTELVPGVSLQDGYVKLTPSAGGAAYAWASSVDNVSSDQTFVRPLYLP